jgi:hypothetical protein
MSIHADIVHTTHVKKWIHKGNNKIKCGDNSATEAAAVAAAWHMDC